MARWTSKKGKLRDNERLYFGDSNDMSFRWDGTQLSLDGATDWTWLLGTEATISLGTQANTAGSAPALSSSRTSVARFYADDGGAAISSAVFARVGVFRHLLTYTAGNREQEAAGVVGQLVSKQGVNRHNMCGVMGSYEVNTGLTVDGQAASIDTWAQAAIIARVGAGSGITTINSNGVLAGVAAMSNTASFAANNGIYAGFYVGSWSGAIDWKYGVYIQAAAVNYAFQAGESASTYGSGVALSATYSAAMSVFADDGGAAIGSGTLTRAGRFRNLQTYTGGNREQEAAGLIGQLVSVAGTNRHNMCGLMGSYEVQTSLTVDGQVSSTDPWCQAAVIGRVGAGSNITTINSNGILAGLAAMSNTTSFVGNSGVYAGVYVGKWGGLANWSHGLYVDARSATIGAALLNTLTPDSTRSYAALVLGATRAATAASITMSATTSLHCDPIQMNYAIAGVAPTSTSTVNGFYSLFLHSTADMANLRLKTCDWTLDVRKNLQDAYCIQGELDIQTNSVTVGGEACAMGLTTSVTSAVSGNVWGAVIVFSTDQVLGSAATLFLSHRSTGTIGHAIYIEANSGTTLTDCLYINSAGTITNFANFSAAAGPISASATALNGITTSHKITCKVGATTVYIPVITSGMA